MSCGLTPAHFNSLKAHRRFAALGMIQCTCEFRLRSSLIVTPSSLYVITVSTNWFNYLVPNTNRFHYSIGIRHNNHFLAFLWV